MTLQKTPITGNGNILGSDKPLGALSAFYRGFNCGDLGALAESWLEGDEPSMDNPLGGIRRGWPEISAGYKRLFTGPARVTVEFFDYSHQQGDDWALFVGRERGICVVDEIVLELAIRTTRWFVMRNGVWRQLHHHGSIERGPLLTEYQLLVLGAAL